MRLGRIRCLEHCGFDFFVTDGILHACFREGAGCARDRDKRRRRVPREEKGLLEARLRRRAASLVIVSRGPTLLS